MAVRVRLRGLVVACLLAASWIGCSRATPRARPPAPEPAKTKVDLSPLGEDLRRSVLLDERPSRRGGWMGRLEERVPGFSVSSPSTVSMNGTLNGRPQSSWRGQWKTNDPALTRAAFEAMLPKVFDEIEAIVAEIMHARGVVNPRPGTREQSPDGPSGLSIAYESAGNVGWVSVRRETSPHLTICIDLIEEPR